MTKEDKILESLTRLETGQVDLKLQFINHLEHHRQDAIREINCLRRWIWACIPTITILIIAVITAAYYLGRN